MKVRLAKRIGFCFGVKRAIKMAEKALDQHGRVYSLGSIIHNRQVVERLWRKGLKIAKSLDGVPKGSAVLVSSHGAPPEIFEKIKTMGLNLIDTTCPFVSNAQRVAGQMAREAYLVVIVGQRLHPEVRALVGFAGGRAIVVKDRQEASKKSIRSGRVAVISQTTQTMANYTEVVEVLVKKRPQEIRIFNTICNDTGKRQEAASALSRIVDAMVIIGGRHSANTNRLFEVCRRLNNSYLVETDADIRPRWFRGKRTIGIASGASTPGWVIEKVIDKIKVKGKSKKAK
jgi:4-hydroxy-3-methylbut-2-enyl diphosphate reductase